MPFPWGQSTLCVSFTCPHCGDTKTVSEECLAVCDCPDSLQASVEDRERAATHHKSQQEVRKIRMKEIHERRRKKP